MCSLAPPTPDVDGAHDFQRVQQDDVRIFMPGLRFIAAMVPEIYSSSQKNGDVSVLFRSVAPFMPALPFPQVSK